MKTKLLSYGVVVLLGMLTACKEREATPQPDWASKWQGTYYMNGYYFGQEVQGGLNEYYLNGLLEIQKKESNTLSLNFYGRAYVSEYRGNVRFTIENTPLNPVRLLGVTARAISEDTLRADASLKDDKGRATSCWNSVF